MLSTSAVHRRRGTGLQCSRLRRSRPEDGHFVQTVAVHRTLGTLLTLALAMVGLTAAASATTAGAITGKVTDSSGAPLAGVKVWANSWSAGASGQATTGADGMFTVSGLSAGNYDVCFDPEGATGGSSSTGYRDTCWLDVDSTDGPSSSDLTYVAVTDGDVVSGVVQALPSTGAMSGTVTDRNGTPLAGAEVAAIREDGAPSNSHVRTTTDADGHYVIDRLRPGATYTACVSGKGVTGGLSEVGYLEQCYGAIGTQSGWKPYASEKSIVEVVAETTTVLDPIELDAAARIEGTLTTKDGEPIAGVEIQGEHSDDERSVSTAGVTDANGHYVLAVDGYRGNRLPSVSFRIYFNTYRVPTYVSQRYKGVLTAWSKDFGGTAVTVTPEPGVVTNVDDQLTPAATIAGTVTDSEGTGLHDVSVRLYHDDDLLTDIYSDGSGHYSFRRLPPGDYKICYFPSDTGAGISAAGYLSSCRAPVSVSAGEQRDGVDHALDPAAGISGTVRSPTGEPLPSRTVRLYRDGSLSSSGIASTNADGVYIFRRLPAGTYKVCLEAFWPLAWRGCHGGSTELAGATPVTTTLGTLTTGADIQAVPPDKTAPTALMTKPSVLVQVGRTVTLQVATSDSDTGVASYDLRYRYADWDDKAFSSFVSPASWQLRTGAAPAFTGAPGRTYCFSVRARDNADNLSGYSPERCATVPLDDRALRITSGTWRRESSPNTIGNTVTRTSTYGATVALTGAYADRVALVVTTCPTCGRVGVFVNGTRLTTLSTWSSTVRKRVLLVPRTFTYRRATISLRLEQRNRSLIVDALTATRK